ncbi:Spo0B domain-containing protein [Clostridium ganghwense]|uniref:Spo0B domain-containing protein n=1 Tax=Clostridium ganghwense TaxID=312089 RepID=A0ABT4CS43_9CLOT|nr:Spo0B domain-containing protein [Clostridium ganghwense]MCY6371859.1 Spo0B domain-containing protein [Clostridium ganghwense]
MEEASNIIDCLRKERHDFMNEIQVIYGYLQLKKNEKAKQYIEEMIKKNSYISRLYTLGDKYFGFLIEENLKKLWNQGIKIDLHIEIDCFLKIVFQKEYNKKKNLVNNIFNELENYKFNFVYIYIFEDELGQSVLIANRESLADELEWMEEWQQINSDIKDIKVYKYAYGRDYGYRLTFI